MLFFSPELTFTQYLFEGGEEDEPQQKAQLERTFFQLDTDRHHDRCNRDNSNQCSTCNSPNIMVAAKVTPLIMSSQIEISFVFLLSIACSF